MNIIKTISGITLAIFLSTHMLYGQQCKDFHQSKDCFIYIPESKKYEQYSQAKSALCEIGQTNIYKIVLFGGKDYIVGVCAEMGYRPIHFRIIDSQTKKVMYDNKDYDYIESFGFSVEKTQPVDIEITVLDNKRITDKKNKMCVGLEIVYSNMTK